MSWLTLGKRHCKKKELISETRYRKLMEEHGPGAFLAKMGAEAIRELLRDLILGQTVQKTSASK